MTHFQLSYLSFWKIKNYMKSKNNSPVTLINRLLREYDFLGVVERTDESVVALQMLLGLNTEDVMFITYVSFLLKNCAMQSICCAYAAH